MSSEVSAFAPPDMMYCGISKPGNGPLFVIDPESGGKVVLSH